MPWRRYLRGLPNRADRDLLVGYDSSDDACVYRVSDDTAVIQTVDFFTPIVDDPYTFGQIAAANALSDVYAMGGTPKLAMNLLCVPDCLSPDMIRAILEGGHDKAVEAGCVIAGGHTIQDSEPKYGLCVTGFVHPGRILRNVGAMPGDVHGADQAAGQRCADHGREGGAGGGERLPGAVPPHGGAERPLRQSCCGSGRGPSCTDITGFGLLGHCYEIVSGSGVTIRLSAAALPLMGGARELAEMGIIPAGAYRNMDYVQSHLLVQEGVPQALVDLAAGQRPLGACWRLCRPPRPGVCWRSWGIMPPGPPSWERCCHSAPPRWKMCKEILGKPKGAADLRRPWPFRRDM